MQAIRLLKGIVKTGWLTGVTSRTVGFDQNRERIAIAIDENIHNALGVAGCRALMPQTRARARPEPRLVCLDSSFEALGIHVSECQQLPCGGVLDDGWNETLLIKPNFPDLNFHLTTTPRWRR